jgi:hypothetical protein
MRPNPRLGSVKPMHQDNFYFRVREDAHVLTIWCAPFLPPGSRPCSIARPIQTRCDSGRVALPHSRSDTIRTAAGVGSGKGLREGPRAGSR